MRSDAANLLSRLGQNKFKYQEFRDNFADMELWPLFEALIRDPRISGDAAANPDDAMPGPGIDAPDRASTPSPAISPRQAGLFGRYEDTRSSGPVQEDVRALLRKLNDRVATGEL